MKRLKKLSGMIPVLLLRRLSLLSEKDVEKPAKRKYTTDSIRKEHIAKLMEDIDGKQKQMKFKMLHQSKAPSSKYWETCEKLQKKNEHT